jgi:hypothetical protein
MNVWGDLPNAKHIDFVIESVKKYPDEWVKTYYEVLDETRSAARNAALYATRGAARSVMWWATWQAAWDTVYCAIYAGRYAAVDTGYNAARSVTSDAILSLVAYDDCEQYLDMPYNELLFIAKLTQIPATILLLPYAKAMELIKEKV